MNYLALCKEVHGICQIDGDTIVSVTNQTGMNARIVNWVNRAYQDIQRHRPDWFFRQVLSNLSVLAGQWEIPSLINEMVHLNTRSITAIYNQGLANEQIERLRYIPYDDYYRNHQSIKRASGRPRVISSGYDFDVYIDPIPQEDLILKFWYTRKIVPLVLNTDIPIIRDDYQESIIWKAVMYYAEEQEAINLYQMAELNFKTLLNRMELDLRPAPKLTMNPLA